MQKDKWTKVGVLALAAGLSLVGCAAHMGPMTGGCSVNGTYYPHGNAQNDQCVCPPLPSVPCRISFLTPIHRGAARSGSTELPGSDFSSFRDSCSSDAGWRSNSAVIINCSLTGLRGV
jgi:hypothetical protein